MKKAIIHVKRLEKNRYLWETNKQKKIIVPQTELLLLIGGTIAATILNGMQVGDDLQVDMNLNKM